MKIVLSMAAALLVATGAMAAELPSYELSGFPISPVQAQLVGTANIQEQPPTAALTPDGMAASPHQLSVLKPRAKRTATVIAPGDATVGVVAR